MYTCFLFTDISTDVIIDFNVYLRKNKQYTQHTYIKKTMIEIKSTGGALRKVSSKTMKKIRLNQTLRRFENPCGIVNFFQTCKLLSWNSKVIVFLKVIVFF